MEHISNVIERNANLKAKPISTGFKFLDKAIGGYYPGSMTTICGAEDSGKSAFVISQINHIAVDMHIPTLLVLTNMSKRVFLSCMAAYYCGIETNNIYTVLEEKKYQNAIKDYFKLLKEAPLYVANVENREGNLLNTLEELITSNGIKIVFVDEIIPVYSEKYEVILTSWKSLVMKLNISIVATSSTWSWREGLDGIKPALCDLVRNDVRGQDVVIGLIKYEQFNIYCDETGRDLHDKIGFEILKQKGRNTSRKYLLPCKCLYLKNYEEKMQNEIRQSNSCKIDSLIDEFDLTIEGN